MINRKRPHLLVLAVFHHQTGHLLLKLLANAAAFLFGFQPGRRSYRSPAKQVPAGGAPSRSPEAMASTAVCPCSRRASSTEDCLHCGSGRWRSAVARRSSSRSDAPSLQASPEARRLPAAMKPNQKSSHKTRFKDPSEEFHLPTRDGYLACPESSSTCALRRNRGTSKTTCAEEALSRSKLVLQPLHRRNRQEVDNTPTTMPLSALSRRQNLRVAWLLPLAVRLRSVDDDLKDVQGVKEAALRQAALRLAHVDDPQLTLAPLGGTALPLLLLASRTMGSAAGLAAG